MSTTLVVVPAFNEEDTVGTVVHRARSHGLDVLVVDDGSTDATARAAMAAGARVLRIPVNLGVGAALHCGFRYAVSHGFERVVHVDADLQHDPSEIPDLLEVAKTTGAELVIGSRFRDGSYPTDRSRRLAMRFLAQLVSRRVGTRLDDVTSGFRVISGSLLPAFATHYPAEYLGDTVEAIMIAHELGANIRQAPVRMSPRSSGAGTPSLQAAGHLLRTVLVIVTGSWRASLPQRAE